MATRTISGTLDTLEHEGSEITYKGSTDACDRSENIRGFQVNPGAVSYTHLTLPTNREV